MTSTILTAQEIVSGGAMKQTSLNSRFDLTQIAAHIFDAELRFVQKILGREFYETIITKKTTDSSNYNPNNLIVKKFDDDPDLEDFFVKYLFKFCSYASHFECLPYVSYQTTTQGIMSNHTEFATNSKDDGLKAIQTAQMIKIDNLAEEIKYFLCKNKEKFIPYGFVADFCNSSECENSYNKSEKDVNLGIIFH